MSEREYKTMIVPCKRCGKEFKLHLPMHIYEMMVAAAEEEGETLEFTGTTQGAVPTQPPPLQPTNTDPVSAVALRVTGVPFGN